MIELIRAAREFGETHVSVSFEIVERTHARMTPCHQPCRSPACCPHRPRRADLFLTSEIVQRAECDCAAAVSPSRVLATLCLVQRRNDVRAVAAACFLLLEAFSHGNPPVSRNFSRASRIYRYDSRKDRHIPLFPPLNPLAHQTKNLRDRTRTIFLDPLKHYLILFNSSRI